MSEFVLSPEVVREATSYNPFRNVTADVDQMEFEEDVYFEGANLKDMKENQSILEISLRVAENSINGNAGVKFRTDIWLNKAICAGTIRPADADERDWKSTKAGIRTATNLANVLGLTGTNSITALTDITAPTGGMAHVKIRIYRANTGQHKWSLERVTKIKV